MLELKDIQKYYNPGTVNEMCLFDHFNLKVEKGDFISVVGSNGSGKTSMLNIICGSIGVRADINGGKEYYKRQGIQTQYKNRPGVSESVYGHMSVYDDS